MQVKLEIYTADKKMVNVIISLLGIIFQTVLSGALPTRSSQAALCCNGTLGYVTAPIMPCSSLNCCDGREIVTVLAVNHAFGFVFRCMVRRKLDFSKCFGNNDKVVTSNETSMEFYVPKFCCPGNSFDIAINTADTGILIKCIRSRNRTVF